MASAQDLAVVIVAQCSQLFDRRRDPPDPELHMFDFFQTAIGKLVRRSFDSLSTATTYNLIDRFGH